MNVSTQSSLRSQLGPLLFLVSIFVLNFLARVMLSPLMPTIEKDLGLGHDEAGFLFLIMYLGYCPGLLASGFVSSRLSHRRTIILSSIAVGLALLILSISHHLWAIRLSLIFLGVAAGFYLPSGIATLTELVRPEDWGKAIAIHELAPNLGFVTAPLLAAVLLGLFSWRGVLLVTGIGSIVAGTIFILWGKGGTLPGETPNLKALQSILIKPSFWIMIALFSLGIGASFGVYSMIPLYLVSEKGIERTWANTLLGLSRISSLVIVLVSGWMTDRFGARWVLKIVFVASGLATIILGIASGTWIVIMLFVQPMIATCFFPAGFAALSRMGSPKIKNVAISFTSALGIFLGAGAIPAGLGVIGELESFSLGFILFGALLFVGTFLADRLKFTKDSDQQKIGSLNRNPWPDV